jgi:hypothetical protein
MSEVDARLAPLAFLLGVASAFVGHLLGDHTGSALYHLPHQALLAVPLGLGAGLFSRSGQPGILTGVFGSIGGFLLGAVVVSFA